MVKIMRNSIFLFFVFLLSIETTAKKLRVLFIGNSYIFTNNLPDMLFQIAKSQGDTLVWDGNLIGGFTFANHFSNALTKQKIALGNWDFVILQGQSQEAAFPDWQVNANTIPFAKKLDSLVNASNACTETQFFMTWGRKNGDASNCAGFPPICTFIGMQNLLRDRYLEMARVSKGSVSPVGEAWRSSIASKPFLELYNPDQSHPIATGTFLSALVFYQTIFRKNIESNAYKPAGIQDSTATFLLHIAKKTVQDSASKWFRNGRLAKADFTYSIQNNLVQFSNKSFAATDFKWSFGNNNSSIENSPSQIFQAPGVYTVKLRVKNDCKKDSIEKIITILPSTSSKPQQIKAQSFFPNPCHNYLNFKDLHDIQNIEIFDITGRKFLDVKWNHLGLETQHLPSGIYQILVTKRAGVQIHDHFSKW